MKEELNQIKKNQMWELVPRTMNKDIIGANWVFTNKINEDGQLARNNTSLVCKGYAQVEGIDFEEIFSLVARLEIIRMFLEFSLLKMQQENFDLILPLN